MGRLDIWLCTICEYIYDPQLGDPDNDIPTGTSFDELPEEWVCPNCGAEKDLFVPYTETKDDDQ
ncbi:unnamed protein product [marine sediment metagenome]|uniref:Rubredoxin-like domain-containing protein n=1 Tax=marine sediment metagenome TaxID=412755 RepID=X1R6S9_9ZZZZ